jgi:uncharacterized membrane protein YgcG
VKRALLAACACLAASFWTACSAKTTPLTQIVVAVDSDWDGFVRAEIAIEGFEKKPAPIQANLSRASARRVALIHDGGPLGPLSITVRAYVEGNDEPVLIEPREDIFFVQNETRLLRIDLLLHCIEKKCDANEACVAAGRGVTCADDGAQLTDWHGDIGAIDTKYHLKDGDVLPADAGSTGTGGSNSGSGDGGPASGSGGNGGGSGGNGGGSGGNGGGHPDGGPTQDAGDSGPMTQTDSGTGGSVFPYTPANVDLDDTSITKLTPAPVTLNCDDPTFDSSTMMFPTWCGEKPPTAVIDQDSSHDAAVLVMKSLTLSSLSTLHLIGDKPVILLVYGDANIDGVIDASAHRATPGPGGNRDCVAGTGANGSDGSGLYVSADGAGGGGFGSAGGTGAASNGMSTINAGGVVEGNLTLVPLRGGCRGGDGGKKGGGSSVAPAGAGGGALQISAAGHINISGSVLAVGGGGGVSSESQAGGAGGGSGGAILLEGSNVGLGASAVVSVNGGGGGAGQSGANTAGIAGEDGHAAASAALGGPMNGTGAAGGAGGPGAWRDADAGNGGKPGVLSLIYGGGGGGGGGVGRIRVHNAPSCMPAGIFTPRPSLTCASCGTCADPAPLGCTSSKNAGITYAVCSTGVAWATARDRCIAAGMHLARIDNASENTWLATQITGNTWIGGNDMVEDDWVWVDNGSQFWNGDENGSTVTYSAWLSGEPNDSPAPQDCAAIGTDAKWRDFNCTSDLMPYACEHAP